MTTKTVCLAATCVLLSTLPKSAAALELRLDSYSVMRSESDPGLAINRFHPIAPLNGDVTVDLALGESQTIDLFSVGTRERAVDGDDFVRRNIRVMFQFREPQSSFTGVVNGGSFGVGQQGRIVWADPVSVEFGSERPRPAHTRPERCDF